MRSNHPPTPPGRQPRDPRRGQILIVFVVVFALLLGMLALMLDGGRVFWEKRRAQNAADAGAMAGGHELRRGSDLALSDVKAWVSHDAELYGFTADEVTVEYPPAVGTYAGEAQFVAVEVARDVPLTFMRLFGQTTATVRARAIAGLQPGGDACVLALNNNATRDALKFNGGVSFDSNCGIMANSTDPNAMRNVGGGTVNAAWVGVSGGYSGGGSTTPAPVSGVPPMLDPLAQLEPPMGVSAGSSSNSGGVTTFRPGFYNREIKINGGTNVFLPGTYVLNKGMKITGGDVSGSEVFFYNANLTGRDFIDIGGNGDVQLSAPTTGEYKGILFFNNRDAPARNPGNKIARGSSTSSFQGALYFPSQHLDWAGNPSTSSAWALVIADTINISGTSDIKIAGSPPSGETPPTYTAVLFE